MPSSNLSLDAADYLIKSVNPVELKQRVRRCLEAQAARVEPTVRRPSTDLGDARVLIVDDEPLNLTLLEPRLKPGGLSRRARRRRDGGPAPAG